jgi:DNA-binding response OmpR family regulator
MSLDVFTSDPIASGVRQLVGAEVLVIDKDERVQRGVTQLLSAASLHVTCVDDPSSAWELLEKRFFSVVVVDLDTPHPNAGLETAATVQISSPTSMVIMLTPRKSFDDAVASLRAGAVDVILKTPPSVVYLKDRVMDAAGRSADKREVDSILLEVRDLHEDFLRRFMEAERRAVDLEDRVTGRDPNLTASAVVRVLVVGGDPALARQLAEKSRAGYEFEAAISGGQALDRCSSSRFHIALVGEDLEDLPGSMVVRSLKTQNPEMMVFSFSGPGPTGKVELADGSRKVTLVPEFARPEQLLSRMGEISEAFRVRERERRYVQEFRERHYDFLRKYVALKAKIDRNLT